jgi:hypothetical protein
MLRSVELPDLKTPHVATENVERLFEEAARRIDQFLLQPKRVANHYFVSSDFRGVDACLDWILQRQLSPGKAFCEWGSGYGIATMLAALRGFDACGLEVQEELVERARRLAADFMISADFVCGSFVPDGGDRLANKLDELAYVDTHSASAYEELGLEIEDFDLFYTFPWPGEERFCELLFQRYAANGALLLSYHGVEGFRLQRKVSR